jgi:hemerythrin superfamily protein
LQPETSQEFDMTAPRNATSSKSKPIVKDAIALLKADHEAVAQLFAAFEKTRSVSKKKALVQEICTALTVHTQIEEEIFYPAVQAALKDKLMVPEGMVEHAGIKDLIAQLEGAEPDSDMYDAKVKVLSEYVKHHVKEEHTGMFPKAKASSLDMAVLGEQMAERREQIS